MTLLALLRHGETGWSREGRIQGRSDTSLSEAGRAVLERLSLPREFETFRAVCSPLRRCVETADALGLHGVDTEPRIAEMFWGDWEGQQLATLRAELGTAMQANEDRGFDFRPPGGESPRDVLARVRPWLAEVAARGEPTLAISHRGVARVVFATACGWDMLGRPPAKLDWSALQVFRLGPAGAPEVEHLNLALEPAPYREPRP